MRREKHTSAMRIIESTLYAVFQLADIAGPCITLEQRHGLGRNAADFHPKFQIEFFNKVPGQKRNIL
ncbi:hypothetical protein SDC9_199777 [bioreactor metagenome]|uniref:Uncharacterized protein n=1 Tax=bioreactor metagenome TaxID=1076179 RepID=A0A645IY31_9ZZZZ